LARLTFGPISLNLETFQVWRDDVELKLRPQAFHALRVLIQNRGRYVDFDQLIREAWGGNMVSRHTVNTTIGAVRRTLGEHGAGISYRPRLGYRLQMPGSDDLIRTAWHFWHRRTRGGFESALAHFQAAAEEDSSDPHAFEGIANTYMMLALFGMRPPKDVHPGFTEALERAVSLGGWTPELRSMLGYDLHMFEHRVEEAEQQYLLSLQDQPRARTFLRLALLYSGLGRLTDALEVTHEARKSDPLWATIPATEVFIHLCLGDFDAAIACGRHGLHLHPYLHLGRAYYAQALEYSGRIDEALAEYRLAHVIAPDITWVRALEARCLARSGRVTEAENVAEEVVETRLHEYVDAYYFALMLDALGHREDALTEFQRAVDENSATLYMVDVDPKIEPLRSDSRFHLLREKMFAAGLERWLKRGIAVSK
jgi:tetratricopeptide (TPR) repeat protein